MYSKGVEGLQGSAEKKSSLVGHQAAAEPCKKVSSRSVAYLGAYNREGWEL